MLTPVDVQNKVFKGGIGFDKKDVEMFMEELASDYAELYRSNVELKDKVATLDESLQHYRTIEDSVQKSLTISEKAAEETINAAQDKARQINIEAEKKAESMLREAKEELDNTQQEIFRLQKQHQQFVNQFKKILNAQLQLCDGEVVDIDLGEGFDMSRYSDSGSSFGSFGSEGGLGGGGGYTGSSFNDGNERPAGEPSASVGSLNIDPFGDAKNGGGRFSTKSTQKSSSNKSSEGSKLSLNMKAEQPAGSTKVKRNIPSASNDSSDSLNTNKKDNGNTSEGLSMKKTAKEAPAPKAEKPKKESVPHDSKLKQAKEEKERQQLEAQRAKEEAERIAAEEAAKAAAARALAEEKARAEAAAKAKAKAEEDSKNAKIAQEKIDSDLAASIQAIKEAAAKVNNKEEQKKEESETQSINYHAMQKAKEMAAAKKVAEAAAKTAGDEVASTASTSVEEAEEYEGEVEVKVDESTMLDSEDNYSTGFDFVSEDSDDASDDVITGEVEVKVDESTMLDSEDNYSTGFDFVSEDSGSDFSFSNETTTSDSVDSLSFENDDEDEETYVGEVEDKATVNESMMLDSEDNYDDGFNFVVEEESSEDIPVLNTNFSFNINPIEESNDDSSDSAPSGLGANLNFTSSLDDTDDDVFVGDVEDKVSQSNLIGNDDDEDDGFNFL